MADKQVSITPQEAVAAGCTAVCTEGPTYTDGDPNDPPYLSMTEFNFAATVAQGWRFVKWVYEVDNSSTPPPYDEEQLLPSFDDIEFTSIAEIQGVVVTTTQTISNVRAIFSSDESSDDSSNDSSDDSSGDSSEEWVEGPLLYDPRTGRLRCSAYSGHLRYLRRHRA